MMCAKFLSGMVPSDPRISRRTITIYSAPRSFAKGASTNIDFVPSAEEEESIELVNSDLLNCSPTIGKRAFCLIHVSEMLGFNTMTGESHESTWTRTRFWNAKGYSRMV